MPYDKVMGKFKAGTLRSGSGEPVEDRKQAIAIMLSEKRKAATNPEYRSNLPKGVALSPMGDLGQHRGVEAKIAGKFKGSQIMSASRYFKGGGK